MKNRLVNLGNSTSALRSNEGFLMGKKIGFDSFNSVFGIFIEKEKIKKRKSMKILKKKTGFGK